MRDFDPTDVRFITSGYLASSRPGSGKYHDPISAVVGAVGSIASGLIGSDAASSAANTQAQSAANSAAVQKQMYDQTRADQAPWRQAGQTALTSIADMQPQFTHQFNASDLNANLAPNYEFQKQQGSDALNNAASVGGGLVGGNALKGLVDYNQNAAGSAYQQAFNNYNSNQTNIFNRLSNIAGLGQTANANTGAAGATYGAGIGNAISNVGAAQAGGIIGSANAISGGLTNAASMYGASRMYGNTYGGTPSWSTPMGAPNVGPQLGG